MKVVKKYHREQCCICLESYEESRFKTTPSLFSTDGCAHCVCRSCMEVYANHSVNQHHENKSSKLDCPVQGCNQTYQLEQVISKALPFRHRLVFWWRQVSLRTTQNDKHPKKTFTVSANVTRNPDTKHTTKTRLAHIRQPTIASNGHVNKTTRKSVEPPKPQTAKQLNTKWKVTNYKSSTKTNDAKSAKANPASVASSSSTDKESQKVSTKEFVELALARNWSRCPKCRHVVERISGCNYIFCRCGTNFCYRCGKQHGYHHSACPDSFSGKELQMIRKTMFQD